MSIRARLVEEQEVLSAAVLKRAMARMSPADRDQLLLGTRALVRAAEHEATKKEKRK